MTVSSDVIQGLMIAAIVAGETAAGADVFSPRTWPTKPPVTPIIMVQSPTEHKESLGRSGAPQFNCTTTIRLVARVSAKETGEDEIGMALLAALAVLQRQIEVAVINDYDLHLAVQQFKSVTITNSVSRDSGIPVGELVMDFDLEFYQGPEDFAPNPAADIEELALYADLLNIFSPTDAFDETPFAEAAVPAYRTQGPDGRLEGAFLVTLQSQDLNFSIANDLGAHPAL